VRFLLGNLHGFDPQRDVLETDQLVALDQWAVARAAQMQKSILSVYDDYDFHRIYQQLHNFCVVDMGGFYLDIIKDRLYTTGEDSHSRRSAQTAMYHIAEAMVRWIAPILSFTAEEIWQELPGKRESSVLLTTWYDIPAPAQLDQDWGRMIAVRDTVSKVLEDLRDAGSIGSGLDADVTIYVDGELSATLTELGEELRFLFITSEARVSAADQRPDNAVGGDGFWVSAVATGHEKCARCWHRRADVGSVADHPELCARCVVNVDGDGEQRRFA
jgi:isoleucyl-tRNA synthetase